MILSDKSQGVDFSSFRLPDNYGEWILDTIHAMGLKEYTCLLYTSPSPRDTR